MPTTYNYANVRQSYDNVEEQSITELYHDVIGSRAVSKYADDQPLKSSPRVNRVIISSARFG